MHPYQLNPLRFRRLLAAMVTLPSLDEVPYECNGLTACNRAAARCHAGGNKHGSSFCSDLQVGMVLELADLALQVVPAIKQRTAAWHAFSRQAMPRLGLGSFARLVTLLKQYEATEDGELALMLWHADTTGVPEILQATAALRSLVLFVAGQGVATGEAWQAWCGSTQARIAIRKAEFQLPANFAEVLLWQLEACRYDVPWALAFARRVLGKAPAQGHMMLALQEIAEAMGLEAKVLARRVALHERLCHAIEDVPVLRLWWWRCVKRELRAQLLHATALQLQTRGLVEALPLSRAVHLRRGQPMLMVQLPSTLEAAPAPSSRPSLTTVCLRQDGWGPGLGLELLLQGEGLLLAKLQHAIAERFEAAHLHAPLFDRPAPNQWSISCAWCDGLWQPQGATLNEVKAWAQDAALKVLEHVEMLDGLLQGPVSLA
jgi:hypothetical protein